MENNLENKNLIKAFFHLDILTLAKARVPATAHYILVALGHWLVQHPRKSRINNTYIESRQNGLHRLPIHLL
jgi:hypothetical protein